MSEQSATPPTEWPLWKQHQFLDRSHSPSFSSIRSASGSLQDLTGKFGSDSDVRSTTSNQDDREKHKKKRKKRERAATTNTPTSFSSSSITVEHNDEKIGMNMDVEDVMDLFEDGDGDLVSHGLDERRNSLFGDEPDDPLFSSNIIIRPRSARTSREHKKDKKKAAANLTNKDIMDHSHPGGWKYLRNLLFPTSSRGSSPNTGKEDGHSSDSNLPRTRKLRKRRSSRRKKKGNKDEKHANTNADDDEEEEEEVEKESKKMMKMVNGGDANKPSHSGHHLAKSSSFEEDGAPSNNNQHLNTTSSSDDERDPLAMSSERPPDAIKSIPRTLTTSKSSLDNDMHHEYEKVAGETSMSETSDIDSSDEVSESEEEMEVDGISNDDDNEEFPEGPSSHALYQQRRVRRDSLPSSASDISSSEDEGEDENENGEREDEGEHVDLSEILAVQYQFQNGLGSRKQSNVSDATSNEYISLLAESRDSEFDEQPPAIPPRNLERGYSNSQMELIRKSSFKMPRDKTSFKEQRPKLQSKSRSSTTIKEGEVAEEEYDNALNNEEEDEVSPNNTLAPPLPPRMYRRRTSPDLDVVGSPMIIVEEGSKKDATIGLNGKSFKVGKKKLKGKDGKKKRLKEKAKEKSKKKKESSQRPSTAPTNSLRIVEVEVVEEEEFVYRSDLGIKIEDPTKAELEALAALHEDDLQHSLYEFNHLHKPPSPSFVEQPNSKSNKINNNNAKASKLKKVKSGKKGRRESEWDKIAIQRQHSDPSGLDYEPPEYDRLIRN